MPAPPQEVVIERVVTGPVGVAAAVYRHLQSMGVLGSPIGTPTFRTHGQGDAYAAVAAFDCRASGHAMTVEIDEERFSTGTSVTVRVRCRPEALAAAQELLSFPWERTTVEVVLSDQGRAALLSLLRDELEELRTVPGFDTFPLLRFDPAVGLVPDQMRVQGWRKGRLVVCTFEGILGRVRLECDLRDAQWVQELAARVVERPQGQAVTLWGSIDPGDCSWEDLGGLGEVRDHLRQLVEVPLRNPEPFRHLGIRLPKGILLQGPPGTGKTTIGRILARTSGAAFFYMTPADINSKWYGESERNVARLFSAARRAAQEGRPAIVFVDEIDGFFGERSQMHEPTRRAFAQLLTELDGLQAQEGVVLLAATNRPRDLDPALLRPGRIDYTVQLPLPDLAARREIFAAQLRRSPTGADVDLGELARLAQGLSGADIAGIVRQAGFLAAARHAAARGVDLVDLRGELLEGMAIGQDDLLAALRRHTRIRPGGG